MLLNSMDSTLMVLYWKQLTVISSNFSVENALIMDNDIVDHLKNMSPAQKCLLISVHVRGYGSRSVCVSETNSLATCIKSRESVIRFFAINITVH